MVYLYYYYYYITIIILESKKKVGKKVGRLWEAREAPPQIFYITKSKNIKSVRGSPPCLPNLNYSPIASLIYTTSK
jgi:hypothetical protein